MTEWFFEANSRAVQETAQLISLTLARACFHDKVKVNKQLAIRLYGGDVDNYDSVTGRINGGESFLFPT